MKLALLLFCVASLLLFVACDWFSRTSSPSKSPVHSKEQRDKDEAKQKRRQETLDKLARYRAGDRDRELLKHLLKHSYHWHKRTPPLDDLQRAIRDALFDSVSLKGLTTEELYRLLKWEYKDVRLHVTDVLLEHRQQLDEGFEVHWKGRRRSEQFDVQRFVVGALRESYKEAVEHKDTSLFSLAESVRRRAGLERSDLWISHSRIRFFIGQSDPEKTAEAALRYFADDKNWQYSSRNSPAFLVACAQAVLNTRTDNESLTAASRWAGRAVARSEVPSTLRLYRELLSRTGHREEAEAASKRLDAFGALAAELIRRYPPAPADLELDPGNATKRAYKAIQGLERRFKPITRFMAIEGNLFRKGQKIEPIAVLKRDAGSVVLLSRVHLATTSLLPVTRIRSYYVRTELQADGTVASNGYFKPTMPR